MVLSLIIGFIKFVGTYYMPAYYEKKKDWCDLLAHSLWHCQERDDFKSKFYCAVQMAYSKNENKAGERQDLMTCPNSKLSCGYKKRYLMVLGLQSC